MPVAAARRRSHRDEDQLGVADACVEFRGETKALLRDVALDELVQARLVDRHPAFPQPCDLRGVDVDAGHRRAEFGEARPGDETDVPRPNHRYVH